MSRLNNLSLMARGFFFVALMVALALTAVRGQASQRPMDLSVPALADSTVDEPALTRPIDVSSANDQPAPAPEVVVDAPFRITEEGALQKWAASAWVTVTGLSSRPTALAIVDESAMYVGTESRGVFKSSDAGTTWLEVNNAELGLVPGSMLNITALAVDPGNAEHVVTATAYLLGSTQMHKVPAGVYESTDGGETWHALLQGRLPGIVTELRFDPASADLLVAHWEASGDSPLGLTMK